MNKVVVDGEELGYYTPQGYLLYVAWVPLEDIPAWDPDRGTAQLDAAVEKHLFVEPVVGWWLDEGDDEAMKAQTPEHILTGAHEGIIMRFSPDGGVAIRLLQKAVAVRAQAAARLRQREESE